MYERLQLYVLEDFSRVIIAQMPRQTSAIFKCDGVSLNAHSTIHSPTDTPSILSTCRDNGRSLRKNRSVSTIHSWNACRVRSIFFDKLFSIRFRGGENEDGLNGSGPSLEIRFFVTNVVVYNSIRSVSQRNGGLIGDSIGSFADPKRDHDKFAFFGIRALFLRWW